MLAYSFKSTKPKLIGQEHGEHFRESVRAMVSARMDLIFQEPQFKSKQQVFDLALKHLPILKSYDFDLYEEFMGICDGSGCSPEEIVVLNHYTDLRDIGGCTVVFVPSAQGNLLGQTWDIDASALEHVMLFELRGGFFLSIAGCLGLTGFNEHSVGICINNLTSLDARVGLIWPALVRRVLRTQSAQEGRDLVLNAPLGSGHHYAVADKQDFFGVETSGTKKKLTHEGTKSPYFHTNHCLDPEIKKLSTVRKGSTTFTRYEQAEKSLDQHIPENLDDLWQVLAKVSLGGTSGVITCGAMAMNLSTKTWKACQGAVH